MNNDKVIEKLIWFPEGKFTNPFSISSVDINNVIVYFTTYNLSLWSQNHLNYLGNLDQPIHCKTHANIYAIHYLFHFHAKKIS